MKTADVNYVRKNVKELMQADWQHHEDDGIVIIGRMRLGEQTVKLGRSKGTAETTIALITELLKQLPDDIVANIVTRAGKRVMKKRGNL